MHEHDSGIHVWSNQSSGSAHTRILPWKYAILKTPTHRVNELCATANRIRTPAAVELVNSDAVVAACVGRPLAQSKLFTKKSLKHTHVHGLVNWTVHVQTK